MMKVNQYIRTFCSHSLAGANSGDQYWAYSRDLQGKIRNNDIPSYLNGYPTVDSNDKEHLPVILRYRTDKDISYISSTKFIGHEHSGAIGRGNNYLTHGLIVENLNEYPILLYGTDTFKYGLTPEEDAPSYEIPWLPEDDAVTFNSNRQLEKALQFITSDKSQFRANCWFRILEAVLCRDENNKVIVCDRSENIPYWVALITMSLPLKCSLNISFATSAFTPLQSRFELRMVPAEFCKEEMDEVQAGKQHYVFNIPERKLEEKYKGGENAGKEFGLNNNRSTSFIQTIIGEVWMNRNQAFYKYADKFTYDQANTEIYDLANLYVITEKNGLFASNDKGGYVLDQDLVKAAFEFCKKYAQDKDFFSIIKPISRQLETENNTTADSSERFDVIYKWFIEILLDRQKKTPSLFRSLPEDSEECEMLCRMNSFVICQSAEAHKDFYKDALGKLVGDSVENLPRVRKLLDDIRNSVKLLDQENDSEFPVSPIGKGNILRLQEVLVYLPKALENSRNLSAQERADILAETFRFTLRSYRLIAGDPFTRQLFEILKAQAQNSSSAEKISGLVKANIDHIFDQYKSESRISENEAGILDCIARFLTTLNKGAYPDDRSFCRLYLLLINNVRNVPEEVMGFIIGKIEKTNFYQMQHMDGIKEDLFSVMNNPGNHRSYESYLPFYKNKIDIRGFTSQAECDKWVDEFSRGVTDKEAFYGKLLEAAREDARYNENTKKSLNMIYEYIMDHDGSSLNCMRLIGTALCDLENFACSRMQKKPEETELLNNFVTLMTECVDEDAKKGDKKEQEEQILLALVRMFNTIEKNSGECRPDTKCILKEITNRLNKDNLIRIQNARTMTQLELSLNNWTLRDGLEKDCFEKLRALLLFGEINHVDNRPERWADIYEMYRKCPVNMNNCAEETVKTLSSFIKDNYMNAMAYAVIFRCMEWSESNLRDLVKVSVEAFYKKVKSADECYADDCKNLWGLLATLYELNKKTSSVIGWYYSARPEEKEKSFLPFGSKEVSYREFRKKLEGVGGNGRFRDYRNQILNTFFSR